MCKKTRTNIKMISLKYHTVKRGSFKRQPSIKAMKSSHVYTRQTRLPEKLLHRKCSATSRHHIPCRVDAKAQATCLLPPSRGKES